ncbi:RbsD/FucU domain-containing protein [Phytohabitans kaempferiae]|uniref:RbsD/FucU domain-containing protein n=1 Tax=Phytohabitans kaempferiae TaxID=1620943 RepID=A0ABV6M3B6_9ACTN
MINGTIIHPDILAALARSGHTGKVLIVDGHFPSSTFLAPSVPKVFLNLRPGSLTVTEVLAAVLDTVTVESAVAATFEDDEKPDIWADYEKTLPPGVPLVPVKGSQITSAFSDRDTALAIMTGDTRAAACIVLSLGLRAA